MKRLMFGIMLSIVGLSYSLVCFHWVVSNPWRCNSTEDILCSLLETNTFFPYFLSMIVLFAGLIITLFEAYRRK